MSEARVRLSRGPSPTETAGEGAPHPAFGHPLPLGEGPRDKLISSLREREPSVTPREIIEKKRSGATLSDSEIAFFVRSLIDGQFTDYQASALLMAIWIRGLSPKETLALTREMRDSGK